MEMRAQLPLQAVSFQDLPLFMGIWVFLMKRVARLQCSEVSGMDLQPALANITVNISRENQQK